MNITQPFGFARWFKRKTIIGMVLSIWSIAFILFSPALFIWKLDVFPINATEPIELGFCVQDWDRHFSGQFGREFIGTVWFIAMFVIPGT